MIQIETQPIDALIPYARNSRTHSEEQIAQIAASIREFGFTNPVLIDADGGIIAGHGRVMGARQIGMEEVPCIRLGTTRAVTPACSTTACSRRRRSAISSPRTPRAGRFFRSTSHRKEVSHEAHARLGRRVVLICAR